MNTSEQNLPIIDCFGDYCPVPIIRIQEQLKTMQIGDTFVLVCDHSCVVSNARSTFPEEMVRLDVVEPMNGIWEITVTKLK